VGVLGEGRPKRARCVPPAAEYGLAGGVAALVLAGLAEGRGQRLQDLLPELTELVLTPYLGRGEAARLAR
jgi:hypothetical protein